MADKTKLAGYGASDGGKFYIKDTIGVPHPYFITSKHVAWASDHCCGILGKARPNSMAQNATFAKESCPMPSMKPLC